MCDLGQHLTQIRHLCDLVTKYSQTNNTLVQTRIGKKKKKSFWKNLPSNQDAEDFLIKMSS